jgi:hypothetical protein
MKAFLVDLENKPGELARVGETLGAKRINITAVSGTTCDASGRVAIMTADEAATTAALRDAGFNVKEIEAVEAPLRHEPGSLGQAARRLADAGVNIEALLPVGMSGNNVSVAFVTDNPAKAREILESAGSMR